MKKFLDTAEEVKNQLHEMEIKTGYYSNPQITSIEKHISQIREKSDYNYLCSKIYEKRRSEDLTFSKKCPTIDVYQETVDNRLKRKMLNVVNSLKDHYKLENFISAFELHIAQSHSYIFKYDRSNSVVIIDWVMKVLISNIAIVPYDLTFLFNKLSLEEISGNDAHNFGSMILESVGRYLYQWQNHNNMDSKFIDNYEKLRSILFSSKDRKFIDTESSHLFEAIETFIVLHEYAHEYLGHLSFSFPLFTEEGEINFSELERSRENEFEADRLALEMFYTCNKFHNNYTNFKYLHDFWFAPLMLFDVLYLLELFDGTSSSTQKYSTHPNAKERKNRIFNLLTKNYNVEKHQMYDFYKCFEEHIVGPLN